MFMIRMLYRGTEQQTFCYYTNGGSVERIGSVNPINKMAPKLFKDVRAARIASNNMAFRLRYDKVEVVEHSGILLEGVKTWN